MLLRHAGANHSIATELEKEYRQGLYKEAGIGAIIKTLPWDSIVKWVGRLAATVAAEEAVRILIEMIRSRKEDPAEEMDPASGEIAPDIEVTLEEDAPAEPPEEVKDEAREILALIVEGYDRAKEGGPAELARFARDNWSKLKALVLGDEDPSKEEPEEVEASPVGPVPEEATAMSEMLSVASKSNPFRSR